MEFSLIASPILWVTLWNGFAFLLAEYVGSVFHWVEIIKHEFIFMKFNLKIKSSSLHILLIIFLRGFTMDIFDNICPSISQQGEAIIF